MTSPGVVTGGNEETGIEESTKKYREVCVTHSSHDSGVPGTCRLREILGTKCTTEESVLRRVYEWKPEFERVRRRGMTQKEDRNHKEWEIPIYIRRREDEPHLKILPS